MFDENQLVTIKWSNKTRRRYESLGYVFTKYGDEFRVRAKDLSRGSGMNVVVVCDYCGKTYTTSYHNYNKHTGQINVDACRNCIPKKMYDGNLAQRAKEKFDKLREFCRDNDYELLTDESEYCGSQMTIYYTCSKHGIQHGTLENMLHGHKCIECSYEERGEKLRHSTDYVREIIESVNNNKLLNPHDYINANEHNLIVQCGLCGKNYETSFNDYVRNGQTRCPSCSNKESYGEFKIRKFLENHNIIFEQEKRFPDCRDIKELPFDFYLPDYNIAIEFDGKQHFEQLDGFGDYEYVVRHDNMKNEYCATNDIKLIRIPYWKIGYIDDVLSSDLCL